MNELERIRQIALRAIAAGDGDDERYDIACFVLGRLLTPGEREVLAQLVWQGPVWDGDIICKSDRNCLLAWGLATRVVQKGQQGFTAANYHGWNVFKWTVPQVKPASAEGRR